MKNASRDREKAYETITQILRRLDAIEEQQDKVVEDLRKYLNRCVDDAVQRLSNYLSSKIVKVSFTSWSLTEIPKGPLQYFGKASHRVSMQLSRRLQEIIEEWEEENRVFANARRDLLQHFQKRYNVVEEQLQELQTATTADVIIKIRSPYKIWIWVSALLSPFKMNFKWYSSSKVMIKYENFEKIGKKCVEMEALALDYLITATHEDKLKLMVQEQFKHATLCLKQIESRIPKLIQADKMLYEELFNETRTKKEIQDLYRPIMDQGSEFRGQLTEFGIKEVCVADVGAEELVWKEDYSSRLGSGAFGAVYQGTMSRNGSITTVALKVCSNELDVRNVCSPMEEVETLR